MTMNHTHMCTTKCVCMCMCNNNIRNVYIEYTLEQHELLGPAFSFGANWETRACALDTMQSLRDSKMR